MYFRRKEFIQASNGLKQQIVDIEKQLSVIESGDIVCRKRGNRTYYSESTETGEKGITRNQNRIYELVRQLFYEKELKLLKNNSKVMDYCVKNYKDISDEIVINELEKSHPNMPAKKILLSKEADKQHEVYEKNPYYQEDLKYITTKGVVLRSKSEREIGNALEAMNITYTSDVLIDCGMNRYYADFLIKRKNGSELVWEHFGREHDEIYMAKNEVRIKDYISIGLRPWDNLIWTYDSDIEDSRTIRRIIQRFIISDLDR